MLPSHEPPTRPESPVDSLPCHSETVWVEGGSSADLATDVHLPDAVGRGVPTLLLRTPYGRAGAIDRVPELAAAATAAGFALVTQDVRGRHDSGGEAVPFVNERVDGAAALEWVGARPWSNGEILPIGDSYSGYAACAAASADAAGVVAVIARVTTLRPYDEWLHRDGVFRLDLALPWLDFAFGAADTVLTRPDWDDHGEIGRLADALPRALRDRILKAEAGDDWERSSRVDPAQITAPILHWTGWWDCLGHGHWEDARRRFATVPGRRDGMIVGPTDHEFHTWSRPADTAEQAGLVVEHADRILQLARSGAALPRLVTSARARRVDHGPKRANARLYLRDAGRALLGPEGGSLSSRPDALASGVAWMHDPAHPVPSLDGWVWGPLHAGLADETRSQIREDVATFTTGELRDEELLAGRIRLIVRAGSERRWHLVAALTDVARDGSATRVTDGVRLVEGDTTWQSVEVDLGTVAYHMRAGHRLRLSLAASAFPRYPSSPCGPGAWWRDDLPDPHEIRIQVGPDARLEIELEPLLETLIDGVGR